MRSLREPAFGEYFESWIRFRRYRRLPNAGGTNDQDNRTMMAFDAFEAAVAHEAPKPDRVRLDAMRRRQESRVRALGDRNWMNERSAVDG
jgi:hypothetical protein